MAEGYERALVTGAHLRQHRTVELLGHDVTEPFTFAGCFDVVLHPGHLRLAARLPAAADRHTAGRLARHGQCAELRAHARGAVPVRLDQRGVRATRWCTRHPQAESYSGNVNPIGPRSVYDESKRYVETLTSAYRREYGLDTTIARIFST